MTAVTIDLPDYLVTKLDNRHISPKQLQTLIVRGIEGWLTENEVLSAKIEGDTEFDSTASQVTPTMAELLDELRQINAESPLEFEF